MDEEAHPEEHPIEVELGGDGLLAIGELHRDATGKALGIAADGFFFRFLTTFGDVDAEFELVLGIGFGLRLEEGGSTIGDRHIDARHDTRVVDDLELHELGLSFSRRESKRFADDNLGRAHYLEHHMVDEHTALPPKGKAHLGLTQLTTLGSLFGNHVGGHVPTPSSSVADGAVLLIPDGNLSGEVISVNNPTFGGHLLDSRTHLARLVAHDKGVAEVLVQHHAETADPLILRFVSFLLATFGNGDTTAHDGCATNHQPPWEFRTVLLTRLLRAFGGGLDQTSLGHVGVMVHIHPAIELSVLFRIFIIKIILAMKVVMREDGHIQMIQLLVGNGFRSQSGLQVIDPTHHQDITASR